MTQQFLAEVKKVVAKAEQLFNIDLSSLSIRFDIRGTRIAGQAGRKGNVYFVRFHPHAIANYYDKMVGNTIAHEIAHIVCYKRPELGRRHDLGWKRVCRQLGGNGLRCHDMSLGEESKQTMFKYRTHKGFVVELTERKHNTLQRSVGAGYNFPNKGHVYKQNCIDEKFTSALKVAPVVHFAPIVKEEAGLSVAALVRKQMAIDLQAGEDLYANAEEYARYAVSIGMKTLGAARSCVKANIPKVLAR